jgi:[ribosomal protein S18]-alanine N-acetyltransferase
MADAKQGSVSYRLMQFADLKSVAKIESAVSPMPWQYTVFEKCLLLDYAAWVAEDKAEIVGFGIISVAAEEAHILNIAVLPARQGQGIGSHLLAKLMSIAKDAQAKRIFLEVRVSNVNAQRLYERTGFVKIACRKGYYPASEGSEDAWVFEMRL